MCTGSEESLGLSVGADLSDGIVRRVVDSVTGLLTSVWDDESYVVLWRAAWRYDGRHWIRPAAGLWPSASDAERCAGRVRHGPGENVGILAR
ncbi:hypothetical protein GCM10009593_19360 [Microlunatus antarcticus]